MFVSLLDHLRTNQSSAFNFSSGSPDLKEFFMGLDFFKAHQHICYLFKLCCQCITSFSPQYPAVTMGKIFITGFQNCIADVVMPCPNYLPEVPDSLALHCTDANLDKFFLVSTSFGSSSFAPDYDPWTFVDNFARSSVYKSLFSSYRSALSGSGMSPKGPVATDTTSVKDAPAFMLPSDSKRRRMEKGSPRLLSLSVVAEPTAGSSKD